MHPPSSFATGVTLKPCLLPGRCLQHLPAIAANPDMTCLDQAGCWGRSLEFGQMLCFLARVWTSKSLQNKSDAACKEFWRYFNDASSKCFVNLIIYSFNFPPDKQLSPSLVNFGCHTPCSTAHHKLAILDTSHPQCTSPRRRLRHIAHHLNIRHTPFGRFQLASCGITIHPVL